MPRREAVRGNLAELRVAWHPMRFAASLSSAPRAVIFAGMSEVTRILSAVEQGDPHAADHLWRLVYDELRRLAAQKLAREKPGQTLDATALVHEAYLRLVDVERAQHWNSRGHFFAAAAEALRRILVEQARRKARHKHGGGRQRVPLDNAQPACRDGQTGRRGPASRNRLHSLPLPRSGRPVTPL
jgi:hypothetical protein